MSSAPRPFQIFLFTGFGVLMFISFILFSTYSGDTSSAVEQVGEVTIWGTVDGSVLQEHIRHLRNDDFLLGTVNYRQVNLQSFDNELLNAIAEGRQPDLILIPHTELVQHRSKIFPLSYENIPQRTFRDTYIDGFEIFARGDGVYGLPLVVDPLIMYWNRDIFSTNGFAEAPTTWEAIVNNVVPTIVRRDFDRRITMSPVALGEYTNITNNFAIISALLLQSGSRLVEEERGRYVVSLNTGANPSISNPLVSTLQFYTQFAVPSNTLYSWNRTKRSSREEFLANSLAIYFGLGSEAPGLRKQNPNLNIDERMFPQNADTTVNRTYGTFYAIAMLRSSQNLDGAYTAAQVLTSRQSVARLADALSMAPAHRQSIDAGTSNPTGQVIYNSSLVARGWLSPTAHRADQVFGQAISDVLAGRNSFNRAASDIESRLRQQF